jgi:phospholipase D
MKSKLVYAHIALFFLSTECFCLPIDQYPYVCFSPNVKCRNQIISEICEANNSIKVQAYSFTDIFIANALIYMKNKGIKVYVILDKVNLSCKRSVYGALKTNNVPVKIDRSYGIAHNKVMIIDDEKVITGSYNFSVNAYKANRENLLILHDKSLASKYSDNFLTRWNKSK